MPQLGAELPIKHERRRSDPYQVIETPTRGAREKSPAWSASPVQATAIRVSAFTLPILLGWLAVRMVGRLFWNQESTVAWIAQALVIAVLVSVGTERVTRRFLPLAFLLNQSLAFPDEAPSRFGAALRSNNLGSIDRRIEEIRSAHGDRSEQQAAVLGLSLVASLSSHDRFTRGHTERVRAYADLIAIELGLTEVERSRLAWGVLLHDIGKLSVPEEILNKTSGLTDEEWEVLKRHPAASAEFLEPLSDWLGEWGRAALEHHERWDGNGYPSGLAGKEISLAGRITAVADAYDVITSVRSYKTPLSAEAARQELVRCASTQFDPVVVRAMLQVSMGKKRNFGVWSWLAEVPTIGRLAASAGSTASGTAAALAVSVAAVATPLVSSVTPDASTGIVPEPESIAFAEPGPDDDQTSAAPLTSEVDTSDASVVPIPTTGDVVVDEPPASSTPTTIEVAPTTTPSTSPTTAAPTPPTSAVPTTTSPPTTTAVPTTTSAPTTTAVTTTTAAPTSEPVVLYLKNPGDSLTTGAHPVLPMGIEQPTKADLGNFDLNRNDDPGITVQKGGDGFGTTDDTKVQVWEITFSDAVHIQGTPQLELYIAAKDFDSSKNLGIAVSIRRCAPSCSTLTTSTWSSGGESSWQQAVVGFGFVDETFAAGEVLEIRVIATDALADDDMMLAYDAVSFPSALRVA